ncbi:type II secretion system protein [Candidatus Collierbacteria bacterium]|nr:type II secretion system protein [Candidatus Collierbacteria bacterium]
MKPAYVGYFGEVRGFTLIELLITSTIIILFSGSALAAFLNYQDFRTTNDAANSVAERLRTIQIKATAVEIPAGCATVSNYVVSYSGANLTVTATCPGIGSVEVPSLSLSLVNSVFQNSGTITFDSRTVSATAGQVDICGNKKLFRITVSGSANVGKPVNDPAGCP